MNKRKYNHHILFDKSNFILMFAGIGLMLLGYIVMVGGGYTDPMTPNYDVKYGFRTTVLAPILILTGLVINGFAIMKTPSAEKMSCVQDTVFNAEKSVLSDRKSSIEATDVKVEKPSTRMKRNKRKA